MKKIFVPVCVLFTAAIFLVGWKCSVRAEYTTKAMYIPFGQNSHIMVDQDSSHVSANIFTVTMPEKIYSYTGERISADQLKRGNILEITGNGEWLLSDPAQYPGVTKIRVIEEGTPQDADQYQNIVDKLYHKPDPSQPPSLQIIYTTKLSVYPEKLAYCVFTTRGRYDWSWIADEASGTRQSSVSDNKHILEWDKVNDAVMGGPEHLKLRFSKEPDSVTAERWQESQRGNPGAEPETVEVRQKDGSWYIDAEPGYIYGVYGKWADGTADYGFITKSEGQPK